MQVTFEEFINLVKAYNPDEVEIITKAYRFAEECHKGQHRESGEPYIIHPLAVAWILANMHADRDTVCAGLLHDVVEDCDVTLEQISREFNPKIAELVDGVTNLTQVDFKSKTERDYANKNKIILGISKDARIVVIKLADRLHNLLTLQYKSQEKRIKKAAETMQFYAPLARYIGAEVLRRKLEDLSFKFLNPEGYVETSKIISDYSNQTQLSTNQMMIDIHRLLEDEKVPHALKLRIKSVYSVYQRIKDGGKIENLHDFLAIKLLVESKKECYNALGLVHSLYPPMPKTFKDYISQPKPNMYSSIHTTVFGPELVAVQMQIRTHEMEKINLQGLTAYWDLFQGKAVDVMQEILRDKYHFIQSVKELSRIMKNSQDFVQGFEQNVIGDKVAIYDGEHQVFVSAGSTAIDYAYSRGQEIGDRLDSVFVNGQQVDVSTVFEQGDRVHLILSEYPHGPLPGWEHISTTVQAQVSIRRGMRKKYAIHQ